MEGYLSEMVEIASERNIFIDYIIDEIRKLVSNSTPSNRQAAVNNKKIRSYVKLVLLLSADLNKFTSKFMEL